MGFITLLAWGAMCMPRDSNVAPEPHDDLVTTGVRVAPGRARRLVAIFHAVVIDIRELCKGAASTRPAIWEGSSMFGSSGLKSYYCPMPD